MILDDLDIALISKNTGLSESGSALLSLFSRSGDGLLKTSDIAITLGLSRQYVSRLIARFEDMGFLEAVGAGPQARYRLNEAVLSVKYLETDLLLRQPKLFRPEFISRLPQYPSKADSDLFFSWSGNAIKPGDTLGKVVFGRYLTDFSWASSRMEGNTYTLLETRDLALFGVEAPGKSAVESAMIKNHMKAIEYLIDNARNIEIRPFEVRGFHALLSKGILGNYEDEGRVRKSIVEIGHSAYRPESSPHALEEGLESLCSTASCIVNPYEQSLYLLANLSYLQPFIDVNKRTARVFSNLPLLKAGLCPLSFFGMNDKKYIDGLLCYYETGSLSILSSAYKDGYRASVERFGSYRDLLDGNIDNKESILVDQARKLVKDFCVAVVAGTVSQDEASAFFRRASSTTEHKDATDRDSLCIIANRLIGSLDESVAIAADIPMSTYRRFKAWQA